MAFAISGYNLPYVSSYEGALAAYEKAHVWKDNPHERGLANRRTKTQVVYREDKDVCLKLYRTVLVRWSPDSVTLTAYNSISSMVFINRLTPCGVSAISSSDMAFTCASGSFKPKKSSVRFTQEGTAWVPDATDVAPQTTYRVNRRKANQVRAVLKPWLEWRDVMRRMTKVYPRGLPWQHQLPRPAQTLLQGFLRAGEIPLDAYNDLYAFELMHTREDLFTNALILGDAVDLVELPLGQIQRRKNKYANSEIWHFI